MKQLASNLALLAGSMDVEAQKRGKANNPPGDIPS